MFIHKIGNFIHNDDCINVDKIYDHQEKRKLPHQKGNHFHSAVPVNDEHYHLAEDLKVG